MNKQTLKLTCNEFISVNHYLAYRVVGKRAMSYVTKEGKDFKKNFTKYIEEEIKKQNWIPSDNPYQHYIVDATYYFPRVDQDASNYSKLNHDCMTAAGVWIDDNMAMERVQNIYYDNKNPRIEYVIYPANSIGIFDNQEELDKFEDKCKTCKRYNNNCSLLRKAKEGRIQEEIVGCICCKHKEKK